MAKKPKKKDPTAKKARPSRGEDSPMHDPEWDVLQERFNTMGTDWSRLNEIVK